MARIWQRGPWFARRCASSAPTNFVDNALETRHGCVRGCRGAVYCSAQGYPDKGRLSASVIAVVYFSVQAFGFVQES